VDQAARRVRWLPGRTGDVRTGLCLRLGALNRLV
jgi:hypothetical protein